MKEIIILRNNAFYLRLVWLLPISIGLLLYYLWENMINKPSGGWFLNIVIILLLVVLVILFLNSVLKLMDKSPALKLTRKGLEDNASMARFGLIKWENIIKSELKDYTGAKQLVIHLVDFDNKVNALSYFKRNMVKQMVADLGTPIVINTKLLSGRLKDLNGEINRRARGRKKRS